MEKMSQEQISLFPRPLNQAVSHPLSPAPSPSSPSLSTWARVTAFTPLAGPGHPHSYAAALGRLAEMEGAARGGGACRLEETGRPGASRLWAEGAPVGRGFMGWVSSEKGGGEPCGAGEALLPRQASGGRCRSRIRGPVCAHRQRLPP